MISDGLMEMGTAQKIDILKLTCSYLRFLIRTLPWRETPGVRSSEIGWDDKARDRRIFTFIVVKKSRHLRLGQGKSLKMKTMSWVS